MKIVHLNTYDVVGGAALATYRLHKGLSRLGYDSSMFVAYGTSNDPSITRLAPEMDLASRIRRRIRETQINRSFSRYALTRPKGYERFSDDRTPFAGDLAGQLPPCDIINLHWLAGFIDYKAFFSAVPRHVPIFWRLSDMNALTGGCHFDDGCGKYDSGCGACPQIGSRDSSDLSHQIWLRKAEVFRALEPKRLHFIALNQWMANIVKSSPLLGKFKVTVVPNGVDTEAFAPRDSREARRVLGIPEEALVVLFAADSVVNRRKGFGLLVQALNELHSHSNLFLLSVGRGGPRLKTEIPNLHVGNVEHHRLLSMIYSAADLYIIPSLQDNQPNTVLEAMACGVPVVGFNAGGIPDMVRPGVTGILTPVGDVKGLHDAILDMLDHPQKRAQMAESCRNIVMKEYRLETQVRRYAALYEESLAALGAPSEAKTKTSLAVCLENQSIGSSEP